MFQPHCFAISRHLFIPRRRTSQRISPLFWLWGLLLALTVQAGGGQSCQAQTTNPVPALTALSPSSAIVGDPTLNLTVTGSGFVSGAVVHWNTYSLPTTYVSPTQLTATVSVLRLRTYSAVSVTATNPAPGGGSSNALGFSLSFPTPTLSSTDPSFALAGGNGLYMNVNGTGLTTGTVVMWNDSPLSTIYLSKTSVVAIVPPADLTSLGTARIVLANPAPGGGVTSSILFNIVSAYPVPQAASLSPASILVGSPSFTLAVNGVNFAPTSVIQWNGTPLTTTYQTQEQLTAVVPANLTTSAGSPSISVFTPTPGGGTSATLPFTITNPTPIPTALNPSEVPKGSPAFTLTVNGTGFVPTSFITWNGSALPTTFVSATALQAAIPAAFVAAVGGATVSVTSPAPGGGTYSSLPFQTIKLQPAFSDDEAVAYQINPAHSGSVTTPHLTPPLVKAWTLDLGLSVSYPLIADGKVFAITGTSGGYGQNLYAVDAASGLIAWGPVPLNGVYFSAGITYEAGRVFANTEDNKVYAFDANTGALIWNYDPSPYGGYSGDAEPIAFNGVLYLPTSARLESDGTLLWSQSLLTMQSPVVTPDGIYTAGSSGASKFDLLTGSPIWSYSENSTPVSSATPAFYAGSLYLRDISAKPHYGFILDSLTGLQTGSFDANVIPAFDKSIGFFADTSADTLTAKNLSTGTTLWSISVPDLTTAPIVVNGYVYVGTFTGNFYTPPNTGMLYAYDENTGQQVWSDSVGAGILGAGGEFGGSLPLIGLEAGQSLIVVPAGHLLVAYGSPNPVPVLASVTPNSVPANAPVTLILRGSGFLPTSTVTLALAGGQTVVFFPVGVSSATIPVFLTAADIPVAGSYTVSVTNRGPGGGISYAQTLIVTPPTQSISGTVILQGLNAGLALPPLDFTLTPTGTTAGTASTQTLTPTAGGTFTLTGIPAGTYTLGIKGGHWLRKDVSVDVSTASVTGLSATLLTGDINGDNQVSATDFLLLRHAYGSNSKSTNWDPRADLNGDGQVSATDFLLLRANYGKQGDH